MPEKNAVCGSCGVQFHADKTEQFNEDRPEAQDCPKCVKTQEAR